MLSFTLERMEQPKAVYAEKSFDDAFSPESMLTVDAIAGYNIELVGTVSKIVSLPDGLRDPTGMNVLIASMTVMVPECYKDQTEFLVSFTHVVITDGDPIVSTTSKTFQVVGYHIDSGNTCGLWPTMTVAPLSS